MSTDLENELATALRHRAGEVPAMPFPPLAAAPAPRRGWLIPVTAVAAAVAGLVAAGVVWLPDSGGGGEQRDVTVGTAPEVYYSRVVSRGPGPHFVELELWQGKGRTDEWRQDAVGGLTVKDGRVVPDGSVETGGPMTGHCYPALTTAAPECTAPGSWFNPTLDFLADASRDPEEIANQLRDEAIAEEQRRTGPGGEFTVGNGTFSEENLAFLELNNVRLLLAGNGVPEDLVNALHEVVKQMPGIQVQPDTANLLGGKGTGYSLPNNDGKPITLIFSDGRYIGAPDQAVVHGFASALGEPPSRLID
jgi:hypothetical protein